MKPPFLFFDNDDDFYAAQQIGISRNRLCREAFNVDAWLCERWGELHLYDAVVITDSDYPAAVDQAETAAAFLSDLFASVRVLALPGGLAGWIERGGDVGSL
jgi:hypothetical protein